MKLLSITSIIFITLLLSSFFGVKQDEDKGWVKIAEKVVNYKAETDQVKVQNSDQEVTKIKIKCIQGTVKLKEIKAFMSDGKDENLNIKGIGVLHDGMSSFSMDLPGKDNKLEKLEFKYDAVGNVLVSKKGKVEVWGKKKD
ncbi:DUF2541 domain-containing protein [Sediminitomix flava]|uniref:Uncharacterized protein n=1 Tax=Sediminitomix flava TaxID=379075 RepID=A0A315ZGG1_SEDFL|nr:DUF2541 domain-containing protein [Sediminitomix flava]PWJ43948.1 hypothetical protein BC781_101298 [Sediminitomix flava]